MLSQFLKSETQMIPDQECKVALYHDLLKKYKKSRIKIECTTRLKFVNGSPYTKKICYKIIDSGDRKLNLCAEIDPYTGNIIKINKKYPFHITLDK